MMEINSGEKKSLINKIQKLSIDHQREIFYILRKYLDISYRKQNKWYTKNQNGIFINLSLIDNSVLSDIALFVEECNLKKNEMMKLKEESQSIENQEICYKIVSRNLISHEDFTDMYKIISTRDMNNIIDNIHLNKSQKKNNMQAKFVNAAKRYSKSISSDKKTDDTVSYYLDYESYLKT